MEQVHEIILLIGTVVVGAVICWCYYESTGITIRCSSDPEIICRSNSCTFNAKWHIKTRHAPLERVCIKLVKPDQIAVVISNNSSGSLTLDSTNQSLFNQTGINSLEIRAESGGITESESRRIEFYREEEFSLIDEMGTGLQSASLSNNETIATRSIVLGHEPYSATVPEINGVPASYAVCSKSMALRKIIYESGAMRSDRAGPQQIEVIIRRPGGPAIIGKTLALGEELTLPHEKLVGGGAAA